MMLALLTISTAIIYAQQTAVSPAESNPVMQPGAPDALAQAAPSAQAVSQPARPATQAPQPVQQALPATSLQPVQDVQQAVGAAQTYQPAVGAVQTYPVKEAVTRIFKLASPAQDIVKTTRTILPSMKIIGDDRTNSLIAVGSEDDMSRLEELLQQLDQNPQPPASFSSSVNIAFRVYAVEIPIPLDANLEMKQRFTLLLRVPGENLSLKESPTQFVIGDGVSVDRVDFSYRQPADPNHIPPEAPVNLISVEGKTLTPESVKNIIKHVEEIAGKSAEIQTLQFEKLDAHQADANSNYENPFYRKIQEFFLSDKPDPDQPASLNTVKKTLKNLLGDNLRVQGYWCGNTSLPGRCSVLVGSWILELNVSVQNEEQNSLLGARYGAVIGMSAATQQQEISEFLLEINLREGEQKILVNSVNARLERPAIVGYTRNVSGIHIPGALVIIPDKEFN